MGPIFLVMGTPACGKSSVCRALAGRFALGLHVPVDDLRHMVVSGLADMGPELTPAHVTQLRLAREGAARLALSYAREGFAVALDDFWNGAAPAAPYAGLLGEHGFHRVLLRPSHEVTLARLHARRPGEGEDKAMLEVGVHAVLADIETHGAAGWHVIDSSEMDVAQTVDAVLAATGQI